MAKAPVKRLKPKPASKPAKAVKRKKAREKLVAKLDEGPLF